MASKLNKKELYEEFKKLQKENTKLQLFLNNSEDVKNKQKNVIECQEEEIKQLHKNLQELKQDKEYLTLLEIKGSSGVVRENIKLQEEIKLKDEIIRLHESGEK